jgi:hypothetical protein
MPPTDLPRLPPIKQRILDAVRRRPRSAEELREIVWADDPNGGPEDRRVVHVHVWQLNRLLMPYGFAIRAGRGAGAVYRCVEVATS